MHLACQPRPRRRVRPTRRAHEEWCTAPRRRPARCRAA